MPKIYFLDLGLRNMVIKQFGELETRPDKGAVIENFVFNHLYRDLSPVDEIFYWRTKNGTEVDFILNTPPQLMPCGVKYQTLKKPAISSGLKSFIKNYPSQQAVIFTKDYLEQSKIDNTEIFYVPVWMMSSKK